MTRMETTFVRKFDIFNNIIFFSDSK